MSSRGFFLRGKRERKEMAGDFSLSVRRKRALKHWTQREFKTKKKKDILRASF